MHSFTVSVAATQHGCNERMSRCQQADAFSGDTALRIRPGVAARSSKLSLSPHPAEDIESSTPPGASSGGLAAAFAESAGSSDGTKSILAWKPLQGRAQQVVLLCWMHGAIGYGYFVMQVRTKTASLVGRRLPFPKLCRRSYLLIDLPTPKQSRFAPQGVPGGHRK